MLYKASCPHCEGHISFEENALGASISCPHCQQPITLTAPASADIPEKPPDFSFLQLNWRMLTGVLLVVALLAGAGFYAWKYFNPEPLSVAPEDQLTVGLEAFTTNKLVIRNTPQLQVTLHKDFSVATVYFCEVTFAQGKPAPAEIDKTVREALEQCVKADASQEILAMAFLRDTALRPPDYSGPLVWKPDEKAIHFLAQSFK